MHRLFVCFASFSVPSSSSEDLRYSFRLPRNGRRPMALIEMPCLEEFWNDDAVDWAALLAKQANMYLLQ